jgi:NAD-dependent SIR2 family protein deacetylase
MIYNNNNQLRPHIVWFGEEVPALEEAINITETADYFAVIGTSLQVYPAAGLIDFTNKIPIYYIDPKTDKSEFEKSTPCNSEVVSEGMKLLKRLLLPLFKKKTIIFEIAFKGLYLCLSNKQQNNDYFKRIECYFSN